MAFKSISALPLILNLGGGGAEFRRHSLNPPEDNGSFILPMKQSFMKDARLMPGTRTMLALLSGWCGVEQNLETTQGVIGKHLSRSISQIRRYIQDAVRLGYLTYSYTKNRIGMITGLRIHLSFSLLRPKAKKEKNPRKPDLSHRTNTNKNSKYRDRDDPELTQRLDRLRSMIE